MSVFTFCPSCLIDNKIGFISWFSGKQRCKRCKECFPKNAVLISEDTLHMYVQQSDGRLDHQILKQAEWHEQEAQIHIRSMGVGDQRIYDDHMTEARKLRALVTTPPNEVINDDK